MPAATTCATRGKPAMQLYRPPTLRVSDDPSGNLEMASPGEGSKPGLNINAKEFVSLSSVKQSKSSTQLSGEAGGASPGLHHSNSGRQLTGDNKGAKEGGGVRATNGGAAATSPPLRVHFTDDTIAFDPDNKAVGMKPSTLVGQQSAAAIKRSKSLGSAADIMNAQPQPMSSLLLSPSGDSMSMATNAIRDMAPLNADATQKLQQVLESPNTSTSRIVMEVVKLIFTKLVQGTRYAEPAARYCIAIIDKEQGGETFMETLLNTCKEYYQERDRLLRNSASVGRIPPTQTKWLAFMNFLHEMYMQVKRRQRPSSTSSASSLQSGGSNNGPGLLLLTLLAECCVVSLDDLSAGASMAQTECLFFIMTGVGRDMEQQLPGLMRRVMTAARDALFAASKVPAVNKTLLQLIEMSAASWQLPAQAVMYYYPTVGGK